MPWAHCENQFILDTEDCPGCGLTKAEWTLQFDKTRTFVIGRPKRREAIAWIELQLLDPGGAPVADEPFRVYRPDGRLLEGRLDDDGLARVQVPAGMCLLELSERSGAVVPHDDGAAADGQGRFSRQTEARHVFRLSLPWIAIALLDPDGQPVPDEPYELRKEEETRDGRLDADGRTRIEGLTPGVWEIRFPERAPQTWFRKPTRSDTAWIDLALRDPFGRPAANEPYEVELPTGRRVEGSLDAQGRAHIETETPGLCRVRFPNRSGFDWAPVARPPRHWMPTDPERVETGTGAPTPEPRRVEPAQSDPEAWLSVVLHDHDSRPVANEPYVVELPDGTQVSGELDASGRARIETGGPGLCKVNFPQRAGLDWSRA